MRSELLIQSGGRIFLPPVKEGVEWSTQRQGSPGKLTFSIPVLGQELEEGSPVRFQWEGKPVFYGFVFTKKRTRDGFWDVVAYDQLRYLKNKDTYVYVNKTAGQVVQMIAADFRLQCGALDSCGFKIASRVEDNQTLFDIIQNALDETLMNTRRLYVLFDDFGKLSLRDASALTLDLLLEASSAQDFSYSSSIDSQTYNTVKLSRHNEEAGTREIFIAQHGENRNRWGVLQYFDTIQGSTDGKAKADALLELYNAKTRTLSVSGVFGDVRARAGASLAVKLDLGDVSLQNYMLIESARHCFSLDQHTMDLTLRGGEITG